MTCKHSGRSQRIPSNSRSTGRDGGGDRDEYVLATDPHPMRKATPCKAKSIVSLVSRGRLSVPKQVLPSITTSFVLSSSCCCQSAGDMHHTSCPTPKAQNPRRLRVSPSSQYYLWSQVESCKDFKKNAHEAEDLEHMLVTMVCESGLTTKHRMGGQLDSQSVA